MRFAAVVLLSCCGGEVKHVVHENDGLLCLEGAQSIIGPRPVELIAGDSLAIQISWDTKLCSGCTSDLTTSCTATVDGDRIIVESLAEWDREDSGLWSGWCSDNCNYPSTTCDTPPLFADDYILSHGEGTLAFTVPGTVDPACL